MSQVAVYFCFCLHNWIGSHFLLCLSVILGWNLPSTCQGGCKAKVWKYQCAYLVCFLEFIRLAHSRNRHCLSQDTPNKLKWREKPDFWRFSFKTRSVGKEELSTFRETLNSWNQTIIPFWEGVLPFSSLTKMLGKQAPGPIQTSRVSLKLSEAPSKDWQP